MAGASRVKGIAIELSIDGSKVTKWLESSRTPVRKLQDSLKDLEKSLKLNPTNTDLIKQKFELLGQTIDKTRNYLADLKNSFERLSSKTDPTAKDIEQMQKLQREISDVEKSLQSLGREYSMWSSTSGQYIKAVGQQMQELGSTIQQHGRDIQTLGMEWERISAPAQAAFGFAIKEGMDFEKGMSSVKAVTGATSEEFEMLETAARDMARQTVFSAGEVSEAEYYMGLAGWSAQESVDGLAGVLDLAAAGQIDLGRASSIVVDGITAMGYTADDSTHFVNVLAAAMSNSNTTVDLLGESFKYAAPLAGTLGYSVEDLTLGLGLMASAGIKGSQAGTGLRMAMKNMAAPTAEQAALMEDFNITMEDGYGNALPFRDVINKLRDNFGGLNLELIDSEGNLKTGEQLMEEYGDSLPATQMEKFAAIAKIVGVRALPGVLGMIQATDEDFNQLAGAIDNADGSFVEMEGHVYPLQEAMALFGEEAVLTQGRLVGTAEAMRITQLDNLSGQLTLLRDNLADIGIAIYEEVAPYIKQFVDWVGQLAEKFRNLDPETKKTIITIAAIVAAIGPAIMVVGGVVRAIGTVISTIGMLLSGLGSVISVITTIISVIGAGPALIIAAVVGLTAFLATHWEEFCSAMSELWNGLVEFFTGLWNGLVWVFTDTWNAISQFAIDTWNAISQTASDVWNAVVEFFVGTWEAISKGVSDAWDAIVKFFSDTWNAISQTASDIWNAVVEFFVGTWESISQTASDVWNAIWDFLSGLWESISGTATEVWNAVSSFFTETFESISETANSIWEGISSFLTSTWETISSTADSLWKGIQEFIENPIETVKGFVEDAFNAIQEFMENPIEAAQKFIEEKLGFIKGLFPINIGEIFSNLKLPHFDWTWKSIGGLVDVPVITVDWYAKAMKNGMLLDGATIFGAANGQLLGGGESGKEWIVGQNSLMSMIQSAVGQNGIDPATIYNAVVEGMRHSTVNVYMDGKKVTNIVARQIGMEQAALNRYYGG